MHRCLNWWIIFFSIFEIFFLFSYC